MCKTRLDFRGFQHGMLLANGRVNMASIRNLAILALLCLATGLEASQFRPADNLAPQNAPTANIVPPQVAQLRDQWTMYLQTKQLDALMALYSKNAMFLDSTGNRLIGQPAIRNLCHEVITTFNSNLNLYSIVAEASGDLAYDSGNYQETLTRTSTGATQNVHGTYIMVFKRQPDGTWRILEQIWTEAPPALDQKPQ
jgi:ketosteroid isomerase-like protein